MQVKHTRILKDYGHQENICRRLPRSEIARSIAEGKYQKLVRFTKPTADMGWGGGSQYAVMFSGW